MGRNSKHRKTKKTYPWLVLLLIPLQLALCVLIVMLGSWIDGWVKFDPHLPTVIAVIIALRLFITVTIIAISEYKVRKAKKELFDTVEVIADQIQEFKSFDIPTELPVREPPVHFFKTETLKPASKEDDYKDIFNAGNPDGFWEKNGM